MSYADSPGLQVTPPYYSSTPPAPPPKPSASAPNRGPPPPPLPAHSQQDEVSELDCNPSERHLSYLQHQSLPQYIIPAIQHDWLPEMLKDKSTADLHHLLEDRELQAALLDNASTTHPAISASQAAFQPIIHSNIDIATSVLELENRLVRQREQTQSRLLALRALEQQHRTKISETEDALKQFSPMAMYQRLSAGVKEQEELLQGIEESWLEENGIASDREVGEFVRRVKEGKKLAFLRVERKRRWDEGRVGGWR